MRTRASVTTTVTEVIQVFNSLENHHIASESIGALNYAAELLEAVLEDGTLEDETLKNQVDCIIVGAVIDSMARHASKYNTSFPDCFHLYSVSPTEIYRTIRGRYDPQLYYKIGHRALIEKTLPFTGNFDDFKYLAREFQCDTREMINQIRPIFPRLNAAFGPHYFDAYGLDTNPMTVDATEMNRVGNAEYQAAVLERRETNAREEAARQNTKWYQPFSLKGIPGHEKTELRAALEARIAAEEKAYSKRLWTLRGYTLLSYLVAPFTLFISLAVTLPWLKREYEALQTVYDNRPWVKLEFPVGMYSTMRAARQSIKDAFPETASIESKPHKVCIALDANGREIRTYSDNHRGVAKVIMLCDKAQAKRWSLGFLETVTAETYQQTKEESVALQQLPQLRR